MSGFRRYAIYVVPDGALYDAGSAWLGWDSAAGVVVPHPRMEASPIKVNDLTATPRKYGFHGTIKPPFRLAEATDPTGLEEALAAFCAAYPPVTIPNLSLRQIGRFLALAPKAPVPALSDLAAATVKAFEPFRAPLNHSELAKRRKSHLTDRQKALLQAWGYPYVLDEFRFHITLTGSLAPETIGSVEKILRAHFAPYVGQPLRIGDLALMGEDAEGRFHLIDRYALCG